MKQELKKNIFVLVIVFNKPFCRNNVTLECQKLLKMDKIVDMIRYQITNK